MKDIAKTISEARKKAGLTQAQLGTLLGYPETTGRITVSYWESGRRAVPLEKIRSLAAALSLTLDDLIP